ncbi:MAG: iron-sulfur cluster assembly scaffold protein [Desulfatiglandales bacterium]
MDKKKFDFWQDHSRNYLEMAFRADRQETIVNPHGYGDNVGVCGDRVEMFLMTEGGRITSVSFRAQGCMNTNACANTVAELAEGKTLEEAWEITPQDVIDFLKTLPADSTHCAELAVGAFYRALSKIKTTD